MTNTIKTETATNLFVVFMALAALLAFAPGCGGTPPEASPLVGRWESTASTAEIVLRAGGACAIAQNKEDPGAYACTWSADETTLVILTPVQTRAMTWELVEPNLLRLVEGSNSATYERAAQ